MGNRKRLAGNSLKEFQTFAYSFTASLQLLSILSPLALLTRIETIPNRIRAAQIIRWFTVWKVLSYRKMFHQKICKRIVHRSVIHEICVSEYSFFQPFCRWKMLWYLFSYSWLIWELFPIATFMANHSPVKRGI